MKEKVKFYPEVSNKPKQTYKIEKRYRVPHNIYFFSAASLIIDKICTRSRRNNKRVCSIFFENLFLIYFDIKSF